MEPKISIEFTPEQLERYIKAINGAAYHNDVKEADMMACMDIRNILEAHLYDQDSWLRHPSNSTDQQWFELMRRIMQDGVAKTDRTGTGTRSVAGHMMRFDLKEGFPLITAKKMHLKSVIHELLWFLKGDTNVKYLHDNGVSIWDEWQDANGDLGPVYGKQWVNWGGIPTRDYDGEDGPASKGEKGINQIQQVIFQLRSNPDSRRILVSAWNVADLPDMALAPCHLLFQFITEPLTMSERYKIYGNMYPIHTMELKTAETFDQAGIPRYKLKCLLYQRSADVFLGVPFNIASYALLTMMVAQQVNMVADEFIHFIGDAHLYQNHLPQASEALNRDKHPLPVMRLTRKPESIFDYRYEDFELHDYKHSGVLKAEVAI